MINSTELLAKGYKKFSDPCGRKEVTGFFERRVWRLVDGKSKIAYAIHVYLWTFHLARPAVNQVEVKVNLFTEFRQSLDLTFYVKEETTIEKIEEFSASAYLKLGCIPDIHNNH